MNYKRKVAQFYKVSREQFVTAYIAETGCGESYANMIYDKIELPVRKTRDSAGYDFMFTRDIVLNPGETVKIPTGIRCYMDEGYVLKLYPRSSLGFNYRLQLDNTTGIIDGDYFNSYNEGHIFAKITNCSSDKVLELNVGDSFMQGIFSEYYITFDDEADGIRNGGFGSTGN